MGTEFTGRTVNMFPDHITILRTRRTRPYWRSSKASRVRLARVCNRAQRHYLAADGWIAFFDR